MNLLMMSMPSEQPSQSMILDISIYKDVCFSAEEIRIGPSSTPKIQRPARMNAQIVSDNRELEDPIEKRVVCKQKMVEFPRQEISSKSFAKR